MTEAMEAELVLLTARRPSLAGALVGLSTSQPALHQNRVELLRVPSAGSSISRGGVSAGKERCLGIITGWQSVNVLNELLRQRDNLPASSFCSGEPQLPAFNVEVLPGEGRQIAQTLAGIEAKKD